jgi:2-succinyl-5-enolpyruvyl-6-hydroxy-3-cyclohexene-1-carboxylate synthase
VIQPDIPFISIAICAGARNLSIIQAIIDSKISIPVTHHFDEREASFFALGTARRHSKPVAVLCTSGTAVSECYSAVIESYYSGIPLVIISADRPKRFRNTGAPQAIEQNGIFANYCKTQDIEVSEEFNINLFENISINLNGPTHINFCIDEPNTINKANAPVIDNNFDPETKIKTFFSLSKNPVVILSGLSREWQSAVCNGLRNLNLAVFCESTSGLRESSLLQSKSLVSGEKILKVGAKNNFIDGVLKIGSTPTARFYRELESFNGPVLSIDSKQFSGSVCSAHIKTDDIKQIINFISIYAAKHFLNRSLFDLDNLNNKKLTKLLYKFPNSEPALIHRLSLLIHPHDQVFLGNSLPIREWELAASRTLSHELVFAQRGTNGIDGQISNFLGGLDSLRHNFGIFGDLTTMYGNNGLWGMKFIKQFPLTIVVINNNGGQIFSRVPSIKQSIDNQIDTVSNALEMITNSHEYDLSKLAEFWQLDFSKIIAPLDSLTPKIRTAGQQMVELVPDSQQTKDFWDAYDND